MLYAILNPTFIRLILLASVVLLSPLTFANDECTPVLNPISLSGAKRLTPFRNHRGRLGDVAGTTFEKYGADGLQDKDTLWGYSNYFAKGLNSITLERVARNRRAMGKSSHVIDFFGSAVFSAEPEAFDSLTGVRLRRLQTSDIPSVFVGLKRWNELTGDLQASQTWQRLDANALERQISKFDIVIFRPVHPLDSTSDRAFKSGDEKFIQAFLRASLTLLDRAWTRMTFDDGLMLAQITEQVAQSNEFLTWLMRARMAGVDVEVVEDLIHYNGYDWPIVYLRFNKRAGSPAHLIRL